MFFLPATYKNFSYKIAKKVLMMKWKTSSSILQVKNYPNSQAKKIKVNLLFQTHYF